MVVFILIFLCGVSVGSCLAAALTYQKPSGTLKIDHTNPEKDIYRFEVNSIEDLSNHKQIVLKVDNNADLSQK